MRVSPQSLGNFRQQLLRWYSANRRPLPWRTKRDPYRVWLAEVMLQQTRIAAVLPYYQKFLRRFPTIRSLARARQEEVLRHWAGLGYYNRARNLHGAARQIVHRHAGKFPRDPADALALFGIGRYTAAAVLSIVYDAPLAVLDGNVARVLARLGAVRGNVREPRLWRRLSEEAQRLLASRSPGDWNQALMELGETVCTPVSPHCHACPVARFCRAHARGLVGQIPTPRPRRDSTQIEVAAAVLLDPQGRTLLLKDPNRHNGQLFSRMWQFPALEVRSDPKSELVRHLSATLGTAPQSIAALQPEQHGVTFRSIRLLPYLARVSRLPRVTGSRSLPLGQISRVPVSSATLKLARSAMAHLPG